MQNKGLIKFLAWAFALVCLFQLSFTVVTSVVQSKAKTDAKNYVNSEQVQKLIADRTKDQLEAQIVTDSIMNAREAHYLDSMATEKVYLGYTYRECQGREINLGLDLKGGMNVMLEVSTVDVVRALATTNAEDPTFADVTESRNASKLGYGVVFTKYTGARGKSGTSDASAETVGLVRRIMDEAGVIWQTGELGKVDMGGGGTVAAYLANLDMDVIDMGVPVLCMHAPYEVTSKLDTYQCFKAAAAFFESTDK